MRHARRSITLITIVLCLSATASAQSFDLSWFTIDGGGGVSLGGPFGAELEVSGTIGQPDAGGPLTGGGFELVGGFWFGMTGLVPPCPGDLDGNGSVDLSDLSVLLSHFGTPGGAAPADGDLDNDGDVDIQDLAGLLAVFGAECP